MSQFEQIKNSTISTMHHDQPMSSNWPKWMISGLVVSALIGFAITWFYISPIPSPSISAESSERADASTEQIKSEAPVIKSTTEEITNRLSTQPTPNDTVSKTKPKATLNNSNDGWSADSFLDVLKEPSTDSSTTSAIEKVVEQTTVVKKDSYIASLVNEAVGLSENDTANTKASGDQGIFSAYIPVEDKESTPLRLSSDGLLIVQDGDSLTQIALWLYGDSTKYKRIFEENRDTLNNPDKLSVGAQLRIPASQ